MFLDAYSHQCCARRLIGCKKRAGGLVLNDLLVNDRITKGIIDWGAYNEYIKR